LIKSLSFAIGSFNSVMVLWCHISDMFRNRYMTVIISIAKEVDMAKDYLGWNYQATQFAV
jgi:hypothetical protein